MTFDRSQSDPAQTPPPADDLGETAHAPTDPIPEPATEPPPVDAIPPAPAPPTEPVEPPPPPPGEPVELPPLPPLVEPVEPVAAAPAPPPTEPVPVAPPVQPVQPVQPAASQVNVNATPVAAAPVATAVDTGPGPLYWARRILSLLFAVLFVLLGIRIFLLLLVADESNDIVNFVYSVTEPFVAPFRGMFQFDEVVAGARTLDVAALAALIGWLLIYVLIMALLRLGDRR